MINCEAYELLSFLAGLDHIEDMLIPAAKVNKVEDLLWEENIRCDFSLQAFERAVGEYPDRFAVTEREIIIKSCPNASQFIYYNSNCKVAGKIEELWESIKEF